MRAARDLISTSMHTIRQALEFALLVTGWTLWQLSKPTLVILLAALCLRPFII